MSTVSGPYTISPTQPANVPQPLSGGTLGLCVLDNLSGYLLQVNVGPNVFFQAPLVEAAYDLTAVSGAPLQIAAILLPGDLETSGVVAPTWYDVGENPDTSQWPIALSGPAEVAAATAAALVNSGIPSVLTTTVITNTDAIQGGAQIVYDVHGYASLVVSVHDTGAGASTNYGVTVSQQAVGGTAPTSIERIVGPPQFPAGWDALLLLPVTGPQLVVKNESPDGAANVAHMTIIGTNRQLSRPYYQNARFATIGTRWVSGAAPVVVGQNGLLGLNQLPPTLTSKCRVHLQIDDAQCAFVLQCQSSDGLGNLISLDVLDSSQLTNLGTHRAGAVPAVLPAGAFWWNVQGDIASAGNVNITIDIRADV